MIKYAIIVMVYLAIGIMAAIALTAYSPDKVDEELVTIVIAAWPLMIFLAIFYGLSHWLAEAVIRIADQIREEDDDD